MAFLFCPRFIWYQEVLNIPENQERRFKVQKGRQVHADKERQNPDYSRKKLGVIEKQRQVYLGAEQLPFRGVVDEVLTFADGSMAPLDYKFAVFNERIYKTYRTQAIIYARLIHEIYQVEVTRAFLVFTRSGNQLVPLTITRADFDNLTIIHKAMVAIMKGRFPAATRQKTKCADCCYRKICPK